MLINNNPKKIFVLNFANISKILFNFKAKICVKIKLPITKTTKNSIEKDFIDVVIIKNQKEKPNVTAKALYLGDDNSILNRIN